MKAWAYAAAKAARARSVVRAAMLRKGAAVGRQVVWGWSHVARTRLHARMALGIWLGRCASTAEPPPMLFTRAAFFAIPFAECASE